MADTSNTLFEILYNFSHIILIILLRCQTIRGLELTMAEFSHFSEPFYRLLAFSTFNTQIKDYHNLSLLS